MRPSAAAAMPSNAGARSPTPRSPAWPGRGTTAAPAPPNTPPSPTVQAPHTRLWACGTEITIAVARGPRGAFACQGADPRLPTHAATGALARCRASYPPHDPDRHHVWLALVLDARHGVLYRH